MYYDNECSNCILKYSEDDNRCSHCGKHADSNQLSCFECSLDDNCPCGWAHNSTACMVYQHRK